MLLLDMSTDRDNIFGKLPQGTFMWCLHCERTYLHGNYRTMMFGDFLMQLCPYEDCGGDAVIDSIEWEDIREDHPEYPEYPTHGEMYAW